MELFVLTGAPGTGKTAILERLSGEIRCVREPAREILHEQRSTGGTGIPDRDPSRFVDLLLRRSIEKYEASARSDATTLFDRGVPDCIAYATMLGTDPTPSVSASERFRYHNDVLLLETWEEIYEVDDERTMSFEAVEAFHVALVDAYERARYTLVTVPRDSVERRAAFVRDFIARADVHPRGR